MLLIANTLAQKITENIKQIIGIAKSTIYFKYLMKSDFELCQFDYVNQIGLMSLITFYVAFTFILNCSIYFNN